MIREDVRLELYGFERMPEFGSYAKGLVDDLHLEAPSDSTTTAAFTLLDSRITGAVQISSSQGVFSARERGNDPFAVADRIAEDIRQQFAIWKRNRWRSEQPTKEILSPLSP